MIARRLSQQLSNYWEARMSNKVPQIRFNGYSDAWEERKLGEVYNFQYGQFNNNPDNGGQYPIYGANGIIGGYDEYNSENAIVIGHMGAYAGHVLWAEGKHFVTYNGTMGIADKSILNSNFGYYLVVSVNVPKLTTGSGQPFVSYSDLNGIKILIPTIEEQQKIGSFFKQLDNTIALHQRKLDLLKEQKKGYLQKMFPKNGAKVPELRFAGFADDWEERKLSEIVNIYDGTHQTPIYTDSGVKFVSVENISNLETKKYISREAYNKEYAKKQAQKGDVLMTRIGDIGTSRVIETEEPLAYYVTLSLLKPKKIESNFLSWLISSPEVQRNIWKRTLHIAFPKKINLGEINQVEVMIPKNKEQQKIGSFFKQLDDTIALHQRKLDLLKEQKKGFLQKMFV